MYACSLKPSKIELCLTYCKYTILSKDEVPAFADWGTRYRTLALDPSIYLHWLQSSCLEKGVVFQRRTLSHIREAFISEDPLTTKPNVVLNCSGVMAAKLGGVLDEKIIPMRGQLVIVANQSKGMWSISGAADFDNSIGECCYIIDRPAGELVVIHLSLRIIG
jgi:D-amino-acid oxidase